MLTTTLAVQEVTLVQVTGKGTSLITMSRTLIGAVPVAGNVADIFWRANRLNLELLTKHARPGHPLTRSDYVVLFAIAGIFGLLAMVPVVLAIVMSRLFYLWVTGQ